MLQVFGAVVAVLVYMLGSAWGQPNYGYLVLSTTPTALIMLYIAATRIRDIFSPLYLILALCLLGVNLRVHNILTDETRTLEGLLLPRIGLSGLASGIGAITLGLLTLMVGYTLARRSAALTRWSSVPRDWSTGRLAIMLTIYIALGTISLLAYGRNMDLFGEIAAGHISMARRLQIEGSEYGAASSYLIWGSRFTELAYYVILARFLTKRTIRRPGNLAILALLLCLSVILPFLSSQKTMIANMLILSMMAWHYLYKTISARAIASSLIVLTISLAILTEFRGASQQRVAVSSDAEDYTAALEYTLNRPYFLGVAKTSMIVANVPSRVDYQYGQSLILWIFAPIPRALWPQKPAVRIGPFIARSIYQRENRSGIPPGFIAELYLNFGYYGIVIGMLVLGMVTRVAYDSLVRYDSQSIHAILAYIVITLNLTLTLLSTDFTGAISSTSLSLLPLLLLLQVATKPVVSDVSSRPRS